MPYAGRYSAEECSYNGCTDYIQQPVTIPSRGEVTSPLLAFWWYLTSQEGTTAAHDALRVDLYRLDGTLLQTLRTHTNQAQRDVWLRDSVNLSPWAGQTVWLRFTTWTDRSLPSTFFVDDVSISLFGPTPTLSPTRTPAE